MKKKSLITIALLSVLVASTAIAAAIELYSTPLASDSNLKAYYRLEGNANDTTGNYNGTATSLTYGSSYGKFGQGGNFNGSNINSGTSLQLSGAHTVSAWVYPTSNTGLQGIVNAGTSASTYAYWGFVMNYGSAGTVSMFSGTGGNTYITSASTLTLNQWSLVTVVLEGTGTNQAKIYINGSLDKQGTLGNPGTYSGEALYIGMWRSGYNWFGGYIDDVAIFSRALTATEVSNLYNGTWPSTGLIRRLRGIGITR